MRIIRSTVLTLAAINLYGCVAATPVFGPDGRQAHAITCHDDWSPCFEKAGEICGTRGYDIWNQADNKSGFIVGGNERVYGDESQSNTLLIGCK